MAPINNQFQNAPQQVAQQIDDNFDILNPLELHTGFCIVSIRGEITDEKVLDKIKEFNQYFHGEVYKTIGALSVIQIGKI